MTRPSYFFEQAGLNAKDAFKLSLGTYSIAFVGTVLSWALQARLGRRTIFLVGLMFMTPVMFLIGFLSLADQTTGVKWAQSVLLLVWFGGYGLVGFDPCDTSPQAIPSLVSLHSRASYHTTIRY